MCYGSSLNLQSQNNPPPPPPPPPQKKNQFENGMIAVDEEGAAPNVNSVYSVGEAHLVSRMHAFFEFMAEQSGTDNLGVDGPTNIYAAELARLKVRNTALIRKASVNRREPADSLPPSQPREPENRDTLFDVTMDFFGETFGKVKHRLGVTDNTTVRQRRVVGK